MAKPMPLPKVKARLQETLDVLSDPELLRQIAESRAFYKGLE